MPRSAPLLHAVVAALALLPAAGLAGGLAGCGGTGTPLAALPPPDAAPDDDALRAALRALGTAERDSFLVQRLRASGLTPAFGSRFLLGSGAVVGFVPGRHPGRGRECVVVAAANPAAAAALLEEVRLLAARAHYTALPERTVLVAFPPPGGGPAGLAAVLDAPLWPRALTASVLVAGAGGAGPGYEAVGEARDLPVQLIEAEGAQGDVAGALATARVLREALGAAASGAPAAGSNERSGRRE